MSAIDRFDFNRKFHFVLMGTMPVGDMDRQEKSLNSSYALSHRQLVSLLELFKLNDVQRRDLNNLENIWAVYQAVRKTPGANEYSRDQVSILINVGNTHTSRLYIRPHPQSREAGLQALEAARTPMRLFDLLGDLSAATITRNAPRPENRSGPNGGKSSNNGKHRDRPSGGGRGGPVDLSQAQTTEGSRQQPFAGLKLREHVEA